MFASMAFMSNRFGCSTVATTQRVMLDMPLQKTSEVQTVIISDSEDEEMGAPAMKRRRVDPSRMQYQRYHFIGPQAWRKIISNLIDVNKDSPETLKRALIRWGADTPLLVALLVARRDALDVVRAWPATITDHPHMKMKLFMLVSAGELEPTQDACLQRLTDMYIEGNCTFPGIKPLAPIPPDWEANTIEQIHQENTTKLAKYGNLETVEMCMGRPQVSQMLRKWCQHQEFGPRVQALVHEHEIEWGVGSTSDSDPVTVADIAATPTQQSDSMQFLGAEEMAAVQILFYTSIMNQKHNSLTLEFGMERTVYLVNRSAEDIYLKRGTSITSWGKLSARVATETEVAMLEQGKTIAKTLYCSWEGTPSCIWKGSLWSVLELVRHLRGSKEGSMQHLNIKGYESVSSDTASLRRMVGAPIHVFTYIPTQVPTNEQDQGNIKANNCAGLVPPEAFSCISHSICFFSRHVSGTDIHFIPGTGLAESLDIHYVHSSVGSKWQQVGSWQCSCCVKQGFCRCLQHCDCQVICYSAECCYSASTPNLTRTWHWRLGRHCSCHEHNWRLPDLI